MGELGKPRASRSPATVPGFRKGRRPDNAGRKWPAEVLTPEEVGLLIIGCSRTSDLGARNAAIIATLYRAGLRVSECLALYPKNIDLQEGTVRVLHGKGDRSRLSGIDQGAGALIARWEARRDRRGLDHRFPLFCTLHGTRINPAYVRTLLPRLAREAGIAKRCNPHALRHSHAYELAGEGVPVHIIQRQLGHSSLATTAIYLAHIAPHEVIDTMRSREWKP